MIPSLHNGWIYFWTLIHFLIFIRFHWKVKICKLIYFFSKCRLEKRVPRGINHDNFMVIPVLRRLRWHILLCFEKHNAMFPRRFWFVFILKGSKFYAQFSDVESFSLWSNLISNIYLAFLGHAISSSIQQVLCHLIPWIIYILSW